MKSERDIPVLFISGGYELGRSIGVIDKDAQARLRREGLPCYLIGNTYYYDPQEVKAWIKENKKVQKVKSI